MTSISSTTLNTLAGQTDNATQKAGQTYDQFLNLLTTQLQNQDPLDPMDSSEFTNQLVQFSQVEQGILTNSKLDTLLGQINNNQIGQSLSYIGKDVYYKGNTVYYDGTTDIKAGYAIDGEYASAKLRVRDAAGNLVRTIDVPAGTPSGSLTWDGKDDEGNQLEAGNYTVSIDALDANNGSVSTYTAVPGHVAGVETVDGVLYLALTGDARVAATDVLSVSEPDGEVPTPDTGNTGTGSTDTGNTDTGGTA
jgi:flagellar basal-body rod modification protein FlgD